MSVNLVCAGRRTYIKGYVKVTYWMPPPMWFDLYYNWLDSLDG